MAVNSWLTNTRNAEKTCVIQDGKRKVHYKLPEGTEMVEEYSMETNVLLRRSWKRQHALRGSESWEVEVGDPIAAIQNIDNVGIKEDASTPSVTRRITKTALEWRIRNLPYPLEVYSVTADQGEKCITVRTSNKKYFKKLPVPDLERAEALPDQQLLSFSHKFNTLIITYKKPPELLNLEKAVLEEILKLKARQDSGEAPPNCNPS